MAFLSSPRTFAVIKSPSNIYACTPYVYLATEHCGEFPEGSFVAISDATDSKEKTRDLVAIVRHANIHTDCVALNKACREFIGSAGVKIVLVNMPPPARTVVVSIAAIDGLPTASMTKDHLIDFIRTNLYSHPVQEGQLFTFVHTATYQIEIVHVDGSCQVCKIDSSTIIKPLSPLLMKSAEERKSNKCDK